MVSYTSEGMYKTRAAALKEAARLRKTGRYNAKVKGNTNRGTYLIWPWVVWAQRKDM